jgi:hypothetical protein
MNKKYKDFDNKSVEVSLNSISTYNTVVTIERESDCKLSFSLPEDNKKVIDFITDQIKIKTRKQPIWSKIFTDIIAEGSTLNKVMYSKDRLISTFDILSLENKDIDFILDRDNQKHIKNSLININDLRKYALKSSKPVEFFSDRIHDIVKTQKAKKMIQKIYSVKNKTLIGKDTLNGFKLIIENDLTVSEVNSTFGSKLSRFKNKVEHDEALKKYINEISGWNINHYRQMLEEEGLDILKSIDNKIIFKVRNYKQSKRLGSGSWCLSYDEKFFKDYKGNSNAVYFMCDFNRDQSDKFSMLGVVLNKEAQMTNAHWRNDDEAGDDVDQYDYYDHTEEEINSAIDIVCYSDYKRLLPVSFSKSEVRGNIMDSMIQMDPMEGSELILTESLRNDGDDIDFAYSLMSSNGLSKKADPNSLHQLSECYILSDDDTPSTELIKKFTLDYMEYIDEIVSPMSQFATKIMENKDFVLLEKYILKNNGNYGFDPLLSIPLNYNENDVNKLYKIIENKKSSKCSKSCPSLFSEHSIGMSVAMLLNTNKEHFKDFAIKIIKDNKCNIKTLFEKHASFQYNIKGDKRLKKVIDETLMLIIDNSSVKDLELEWGEIKDLYNVKDETIKKKIENKLKGKKVFKINKF